MIFRKLYHYAKAVANAENEVANPKNEVAALNGVLHNLRLIAQELEDDSSIRNSMRIDQINLCLGTLYKINGLVSNFDKSKDKTTSNTIQKLKWPLRSSETKDLSSQVQKHRETLSLALSADSMTALLQSLSLQKDTMNHLRSIDKTLQRREIIESRITMDNDRQRILRNFFAVQPRDYLDTVLDLRHPTTGFWLIQSDTFQAWLRERGSRLWLSGIPSAGKTIFSGLIVEECFASMTANTVAYFYCDYKNQSSQTIVNIVSALAGQIAMKHESGFQLLKLYYESLHPRDQMGRQPKAKELVKLIHEMVSNIDDVRIVIDGLDECGEHTREATEWLYKLVCYPQSTISFLLLSRDDPAIRESLYDISWSHIEITAHTEDIEHYVRTEIEQRMTNNRLRIRSDSLKDLIVKQLISRAQGMYEKWLFLRQHLLTNSSLTRFRWVSCQLDHLCELTSDSQRRQALEKLPETLHETYERILLRIKKPTLPLVIRTLQWLVYGSPKLRAEALLEALSIDDESKILDFEARPTEDDLQFYCSSFIRRTGEYFELAHFTVQEFFQNLDMEASHLSALRITPATTNLLASRCLSYLTSPVFDQAPPENVDDLISFREQYPFHAHAVIAWAKYMAGHWTEPKLVKLYEELFNPEKTINFVLYIFHRLMDSSITSGSDYTTSYHVNIYGLIQDAQFRPLHAAAIFGLKPLCQWLMQKNCDIGMKSR